MEMGISRSESPSVYRRYGGRRTFCYSPMHCGQRKVVGGEGQFRRKRLHWQSHLLVEKRFDGTCLFLKYQSRFAVNLEFVRKKFFHRGKSSQSCLARLIGQHKRWLNMGEFKKTQWIEEACQKYRGRQLFAVKGVNFVIECHEV
jgi:hypothetical protein